MFDKLLHDYCVVAPEILARPSTQSIFMLRGPEKTIKSIVGLYQKIDPTHEYAQVEGATAYYINRIKELAELAKSFPNNFYYLDAEDLIEHSTETLQALSKWINLSEPLKPEYQLFNKTGAPQAGDPSDLMNTGHINKKQHNYTNITLPNSLLAQAEEAYKKSRNCISTDIKTNKQPTVKQPLS